MVATTGAVPGLVAIKAAILPVPLAARPMLVVLFVQLYTMVPPVVGLVKFTGAVKSPLQTIWFGTGLTIGSGFTSTVAVTGGPKQVTPPLV
jgi:hypothetical protein